MLDNSFSTATPDWNSWNRFGRKNPEYRILRVFWYYYRGRARGVGSSHQARILVVDDFAEWRDQVRSLLKTRPEWIIVGEACNGQEAIDRAIELQPDIVLLDVGMPHLNGIEAAKVIRQRSPRSKLLFVTQNDDDDIRNAAMQTGAAGYLLKKNAGKELVDAISNSLCR